MSERERLRERERERGRESEGEGKKERTSKEKKQIDLHHLRFSFSSASLFFICLLLFIRCPFIFRLLSTRHCQQDFEEIVPKLYVFGCYLSGPTLTQAERKKRKERNSERKKNKTTEGKEKEGDRPATHTQTDTSSIKQSPLAALLLFATGDSIG